MQSEVVRDLSQSARDSSIQKSNTMSLNNNLANILSHHLGGDSQSSQSQTEILKLCSNIAQFTGSTSTNLTTIQNHPVQGPTFQNIFQNQPNISIKINVNATAKSTIPIQNELFQMSQHQNTNNLVHEITRNNVGGVIMNPNPPTTQNIVGTVPTPQNNILYANPINTNNYQKIQYHSSVSNYPQHINVKRDSANLDFAPAFFQEQLKTDVQMKDLSKSNSSFNSPNDYNSNISGPSNNNSNKVYTDNHKLTMNTFIYCLGNKNPKLRKILVKHLKENNYEILNDEKKKFSLLFSKAYTDQLNIEVENKPLNDLIPILKVDENKYEPLYEKKLNDSKINSIRLEILEIKQKENKELKELDMLRKKIEKLEFNITEQTIIQEEKRKKLNEIFSDY